MLERVLKIILVPTKFKMFLIFDLLNCPKLKFLIYLIVNRRKKARKIVWGFKDQGQMRFRLWSRIKNEFSPNENNCHYFSAVYPTKSLTVICLVTNGSLTFTIIFGSLSVTDCSHITDGSLSYYLQFVIKILHNYRKQYERKSSRETFTIMDVTGFK